MKKEENNHKWKKKEIIKNEKEITMNEKKEIVINEKRRK